MLKLTKITMSMLIIITMGGLLMSCNKEQNKEVNKSKDAISAENVKTFTNPIVGMTSADPWVIYTGGYYYYTYSHGTYIGIKKSKTLQGIGSVGESVAWLAPADGEYSKELWAPELHFVNGKWYIYVAADDGNNDNHRMYVIEGGSDPQNPLNGTYEFKGKISDKTNKWAIDGTVLQTDDDSLYFIWSGWESDVNGQQNLYIAPMSNPWTISGDRVLISTPDQEWETRAMAINEGPEILKKDGKIFIVYSASGSWTADYCLGMLTNEDGNVLNPASWKKSEGPVFEQAPKNKAFGVGHCSFVKSPDGKEDWIVYHAMTEGIGWEYRDVRTQKFTWDKDGMPVFGVPVAVKTAVKEPSGQK